MDGLIYNQRHIPRHQWRYGLCSSALTGCGWIATYNALHLLGQPAQPEALIADYQRMVPIINGTCGTLLLSPRRWFRRHGYRVVTRWSRRKFDAAAREAEVCILFFRWFRRWKAGAHFVALHATQEGFVGYNTYRNSTGPDLYGVSLSGFLKRSKYFGAVLFAISRSDTL